MRIGIDAISPGSSVFPSAGGMRMYIVTLTREMARQDPDSEFIVFDSASMQLKELDDISNVHRVSLRAVPKRRALRVVYQNSIYPIVLGRNGLNVLLATCNVVPIGCRMPTVVVIQSLQYFDHPDGFGRWRGAYLRLAVRSSVRRAAEVVCVSHDSCRAALLHTGGDPERFHVIHHGVPPALAAFNGIEFEHTQAPYILTVATLYRYKNIERLIEAYARVVRDHSIPHRLRIVGGDAEVTAKSLRQLASQFGVAERVDTLGAIDNDRLPEQYAGADLFVYPSLYETFGLPPLEAMALGVPVVASGSTAISEVVGHGAEIVNAFDVADIARGIQVALLDAKRRNQLVERGHARVKHFSWTKAAKSTLTVLRSAASRAS